MNKERLTTIACNAIVMYEEFLLDNEYTEEETHEKVLKEIGITEEEYNEIMGE